MMSRSAFGSHSRSTTCWSRCAGSPVRPPATPVTLSGHVRFSETVSEREGPATPYASNASALTTYVPSTALPAASAVPSGHSKLHDRFEPVTIGSWDVPSSSQCSVAGLLEVVSANRRRSSESKVTWFVVGLMDAPVSAMASVRAAGAPALPGLLTSSVSWACRSTPRSVQLTSTLTRR
jgi:hypothetical protein